MKKTYITPHTHSVEMVPQAPLLDLSQQAITNPNGGYDRDPVDVYNSEDKYNEKIDVWENWGAD